MSLSVPVRVVLVVRAVDLLPDFVETTAPCVHGAFFFIARCVGCVYMSNPEDFVIGDESAAPEGLYASGNNEIMPSSLEQGLDDLNSKTDAEIGNRYGDDFLSRLRESGF